MRRNSEEVVFVVRLSFGSENGALMAQDVRTALLANKDEIEDLIAEQIGDSLDHLPVDEVLECRVTIGHVGIEQAHTKPLFGGQDGTATD